MGIEVSDASFESVAKSAEYVVLDFWAPWCGPCKAFGPVFERVSAGFPGVVFGKVNTDEQSGLAGRFMIRSIPTVVVLKNGELVATRSGGMTEGAFADMVRSAMEAGQG